MKYIIFGVGSDYENCKIYLPNLVVGYIDNGNVGKVMPDGKKVMFVEEGLQLDFDKIIITSSRYKKEMYQQIEQIRPDLVDRIMDLDEFISVKIFFEHYKNKTLDNKKIVKRVSDYSKVYVLAPACVCTGGPELLHQLVYQLRQMGKDAYIVYTECGQKKPLECVHDAYKKYVGSNVLSIDMINFTERCVVVFPETHSKYVGLFKEAICCYWWLSVDNYLRYVNLGCTSELLKEVDYHFYQSEYAHQFLVELGVPSERMYELSDYINDDYLERERDILKKEDIIAYNPLKGKYYTKGIIRFMPNYKFVPIENMTTIQVKKLLQKSKIYIDFGQHPGKDRLPREATLQKCCIITGKRGAAGNRYDIEIPEKYKIDESVTTFDYVAEVIRNCLDNYDNCICDFSKYYNKIIEEKSKFIMNVRNIFCVK